MSGCCCGCGWKLGVGVFGLGMLLLTTRMTHGSRVGDVLSCSEIKVWWGGFRVGGGFFLVFLCRWTFMIPIPLPLPLPIFKFLPPLQNLPKIPHPLSPPNPLPIPHQRHLQFPRRNNRTKKLFAPILQERTFPTPNHDPTANFCKIGQFGRVNFPYDKGITFFA